MKTVLMIAYYFPPSGVSGIYRTMRFIKFLPECGWRPIVLTLRPDAYEAGEPRDDALHEQLPADLTVMRTTELRVLEGMQRLRHWRRRAGIAAMDQTPKPLHERREIARSWWQRCKDAMTGMLSTPDRQIGWWLPAVWTGWRAVCRHDIDVLYSTGKPWTAHLVGYGLQRLMHTPWVADFRDPWLHNPSSPPMSRLRRAIEARMERMVIRRADVVVANTEVVRQEWLQRYPFLKPDRLVTVTNGFDPDDRPRHLLPASPHPPAAGQEPVLTLTHAGALYAQRYPHAFFVALNRVLTRGTIPQNRLRVNLVGSWDTQTSTFLAQHPKVAEIVRLVPQVSHDVYLGYLQQSDILLLLQPQTASQIPAKVFEYMQAGKTILALTPPLGATGDLVQSEGLGRVCDATDTEAIQRTLETLYRDFATGELKPTLSTAGYQKYDMRHLTHRLASFFDRLV